MIGNVLQFYSIPAKIDISSTQTRLSSRYVPAKLDIEKIPAKLDISTKNITCNIDSSECFAEEGQKSVAMLISDYAQEGLNSIRDYAHSLAVEGQMYIQAEPGEDVLKEVAKAYLSGDTPESTIKFIPSERPKITWNMNEIHIDWRPAKYICNWTVASRPDSQIEQTGQVTITEVQKPELHFVYTGNPDGYHILDKIV